MKIIKIIIMTVITALTFMCSATFATSTATLPHVMTKQQLQALTPEQALQKVIEGNQRFMAGNMHKINFDEALSKNAKGQHPMAFIFNCVDSRATPELLFDQTLGNIFVGRVAGNVVDTNILGSMEFATKVVGSKLIVVMGHTQCGAVISACKDVKLGNITHLLAQIQPAVDQVRTAEGSAFNCDNTDTINAITKQNVINQMHKILKNSLVIKGLVDSKRVMVVGAIHDIATGKVSFFNLEGKAVG